MVVPNHQGVPTKNDHFGVFWRYHPYKEERLHDFQALSNVERPQEPPPSPFHELLVCTQASGR